jgi:imidazoleglycerol-phosphate dehydratase/histidinol-phosphatase
MVTNQDGRGTPAFPEASFREVQDFVLRLFASQGIEFGRVFVCPHRPEDRCMCRKPSPGHLGDFLSTVTLDRDASFVAGDRDTDLEFARNIGIRGFRVDPKDPDSWRGIAHAIVDRPRTASVVRETRETRISVSVDLDAETPVSIRTGIGFFEHMLEQVAKHGGFALTLSCDGDLQVDEHHTVEDVALALGEALRTALGDKRGIGRFGFLLPMDETEAQISLDLSGRAYLVFDGTFPRATVGQLPTELVPHFFRSVADSLGANLHISVRGENTHHMVEACFKGFGRTLRQAIARSGTSLPSTKGTL